ALERAAPRDLSGRRENPMTQLLSNAEIGWTVGRGPLDVGGRPDGLVVSTPLTGSFRLTGRLASQAGNLTGAIGGLRGGRVGQGMQNLTEKTLDERADIRGSVTVNARPTLTPAWRMEPNLAAQVALADASLSILGVKVNVPNEVKPLLDRTVNEQVTALQGRGRNDPLLELAARRERAHMCRSIPPPRPAARTPRLW